MKKVSFIAILAFLFLGLAGAQTLNAEAQTLNAEASIVNFSISKKGGKMVDGNFKGMKGDIRFEEGDLGNSSFKVSIDAATIDTGNRIRDMDLRSKRYLHTDAFPLIVFESASIEKRGEGFLTKGKLSLHGVSKEVEIPFTYADGTFTGKLEVNRFDYKIAEGTKVKTVGEVASLEIIAVLN